MIKLIPSVSWLVIIVALSACSSKIPAEIRQRLDNAPNATQVREHPENFIDNRVRWGGTILSTENRQQLTRLTVVSSPLSASGVPRELDNSSGRFIAVVNEFLEPLLYSQDRQITITGHIVGSESQKIGEFMYQYPLVDVDFYYLWPKIADPVNIEYPYNQHYDPWFYDNYYRWPYPYRLKQKK